MPRFMKIGAIDLVIFVVISYLIIDLYSYMDDYSTCPKPIDKWQLGTYIILLIFKYTMNVISTSEIEICIKIFSIFFLAILIPALITWTVIGTVWYVEISNTSCIPSYRLPWMTLWWLCLCHLICFIMIWTLGIELYRWFYYRRMRNNVQNLLSDYDNLNYNELDNMLRRANINPNSIGLTKNELEQIPITTLNLSEKNKVNQNENDSLIIDIENDNSASRNLKKSFGLTNTNYTCCICVEEFIDKENVIKLNCAHIYHAKCISQWLSIQPVCPMCKRNIRDDLSKNKMEENNNNDVIE